MSARRGRPRRGGGRGAGRGDGKQKGRWETVVAGTVKRTQKIIYKCKFCGNEYDDPKVLKEHKRALHWDEISQSTVKSGGTLPMQGPSGRGKQRRELMPPPSPRSPIRTPQSQREEEEEEEEESPSSEATESEQEVQQPPPRRPPSPKKGPAAKRGGRGGKNMPLPIGKKRKVTDPVTGAEVEEWIRNPKYSGA